jgi:hypothetical protein
MKVPEYEMNLMFRSISKFPSLANDAINTTERLNRLSISIFIVSDSYLPNSHFVS